MNAKNSKIKVGISIGDPNGIGVEVIIKALQDKEMLNFFVPIIFGSTKLMSSQKNILFKDSNLYFQGIFEPKDAVVGKINVINLWKDTVSPEFGKPTEESSKMALSSLEAATKALKNGEIDVLITAPINKEAMQTETFKFPGHTEYLEHELGGKSLMLLVNEGFRVALVTQHIPLIEVAQNISRPLILEKAKLLNDSLIKDFGISKPKIAILGLNPHSGDNGLLGKEEQEIIIPAIEELFNKEKIMAFGPYAADSFFHLKTLQLLMAF